MANDTVKSVSITNLDATPALFATAGKGSSGRTIQIDDFCTATAAGLQSSGSYYKLCRIPTGSTVKSVEIATDKALDLSTSPVTALTLGWVFSDANDGTPVSLQGLIPTSANTGGTTTIAAPASPNNMYGTIVPTSHTAGFALTNEVLNGLGGNYALTGSGPGNGFMNQPLYQILGFTDGRGEPSDPGGYLDLYAYVATGSGTGQAANIYARVTYSI